jgi:hypothetical protein
VFAPDPARVAAQSRDWLAPGVLHDSARAFDDPAVTIPAADSKTYQVEYFDLDAILSVGYRVHSKPGTQLRIWAARTLRDHLLRG